MKIGELAVAARTAVETIRYYERAGLLPRAPRTDTNYRIYGVEHQERLAFVRHCRALDMTLDEIRVLLRVMDAPQSECREVNALLDEHIDRVATRIRELRRLAKQLQALREHCSGVQDAAVRGVLNELTRRAPPAATARSPRPGPDRRAAPNARHPCTPTT